MLFVSRLALSVMQRSRMHGEILFVCVRDGSQQAFPLYQVTL